MSILRRKSASSPQLVELAILVTAERWTANYVVDAHEPAAKKAGVAQDID